MVTVVGVPGVNISATPFSFKKGISSSGITPPAMNRISSAPSSFNKLDILVIMYREHPIIYLQQYNRHPPESLHLQFD